MEAVKQGTCCVGVRSDSHVVLCSLKRAVSKLSFHHQKLFEIDRHVGVAMSGITADAKVISTYMRNECLHHKFVHDAPMPANILVGKVADKSQMATQVSSKRPFGVGLLVAAFDRRGAHLFETCPSGNYFEAFAMAFGARSQSSKTYLEKHFSTFAQLPLEELMLHSLKSLKASLAADVELTTDTVCIGSVGKDEPWRELTADEIAPLLVKLEVPAGGGGDDAEGAESMELDSSAGGS